MKLALSSQMKCPFLRSLFSEAGIRFQKHLEKIGSPYAGSMGVQLSLGVKLNIVRYLVRQYHGSIYIE